MGVIDRLAALADPARDRIERRRSHRARRPRRGCRALGRRGRFTHALQFRGVIGRRARGRLGGHRLRLGLRLHRLRLRDHRHRLRLRRHWLRLHLRRPGCFLQLGDAPGLGAQRGGLVLEVPPGQFFELRAQPGELGLNLAQHLDIDAACGVRTAARALEQYPVRLAARLRGVELGLEAFGTGHQFALRLIAVAAQPGNQDDPGNGRPQSEDEGNFEDVRRVSKQHHHGAHDGECEGHDDPQCSVVAFRVLGIHGHHLNQPPRPE